MCDCKLYPWAQRVSTTFAKWIREPERVELRGSVFLESTGDFVGALVADVEDRGGGPEVAPAAWEEGGGDDMAQWEERKDVVE